MLIKYKEKIVNLNNVNHIKLNEKSLKVIFYFGENDSCGFSFESLEVFTNFISSLKAQEVE